MGQAIMTGLRAALVRVRGGIVVLGFLIWEGAIRVTGIPDHLVPTPIRVMQELWARFPLMLHHTLTTLWEIGLGLVIAVAVGGLLAVLMAHSRLLHRALYPLLAFLQAVPKVTVAPLFAIWLGYGIGSKVLTILLISVFPIVVNVTAGLLLVEPDLLQLVRSYRAGRWQIFVKVRLPHALPYFFAGMRIAVALAIIGAVVGEFIGADEGLGYLILLANAELRTPLLFASLVWLGLIGLGLLGLVRWTERSLLSWTRAGDSETAVAAGF